MEGRREEVEEHRGRGVGVEGAWRKEGTGMKGRCGRREGDEGEVRKERRGWRGVE